MSSDADILKNAPEWVALLLRRYDEGRETVADAVADMRLLATGMNSRLSRLEAEITIALNEVKSVRQLYMTQARELDNVREMAKKRH